MKRNLVTVLAVGFAVSFAAGCYVPDITVPASCAADGSCNPECAPGEDPDCRIGPDCSADGSCNAECAEGADPDCPIGPDCSADGSCNAECAEGADPDCYVPVPTTSDLVVANYSSYTIWYLYVSPCSSSSWGSDQLGSHVISSGETFRLTNIPSGCYDLRVEGAGHVGLAERYGVSFEGGHTFTWTLVNG